MPLLLLLPPQLVYCNRPLFSFLQFDIALVRFAWEKKKTHACSNPPRPKAGTLRGALDSSHRPPKQQGTSRRLFGARQEPPRRQYTTCNCLLLLLRVKRHIHFSAFRAPQGITVCVLLKIVKVFLQDHLPRPCAVCVPAAQYYSRVQIEGRARVSCAD